LIVAFPEAMSNLVMTFAFKIPDKGLSNLIDALERLANGPF
jgi:hypothetical protein